MSRLVLLALIAAFWLLIGSTSLAGPELDIHHRLAKASAIALIEHSPEGWRLIEWLREPEGPADLTIIHPPCLADWAQLDRWLIEIPHHSSRKHWRAARELASYEQLIYFRQADDTLSAWCETEVLLAEDLSIHPLFPSRKAAAE